MSKFDEGEEVVYEKDKKTYYIVTVLGKKKPTDTQSYAVGVTPKTNDTFVANEDKLSKK
ncbi:8009_t:CDS:2 [Funneliformis geosporum]|uniref:7250_t:CDS:1 n=1 Tax=Funneliformis geosporum TaxID=1117311 RepID=A0A9W4SIZ2_9GLOM|nr:8009_t:CDS:2 [Funneliformis geosporum]CAI2170781.1 7250_t:CDS:2 [Funneliformis geosporum]